MKKNRIFTSNYLLDKGICIWKDMFLEIFEARELIWRFFVRDISAKYKQSLLGYLWILIFPFISIGSFVLLNKNGIINIGKTDIPYPLFALIGMSCWQLFSVGIKAGTNSLVNAGSMIAKINFPKESLVFSTIGQSLFEFLVKLILIIICFFIFSYRPSWGIILFPFALIPMIFLTLGLSLILSLVNGIFRDTANAITFFTTFLMFLTPVLYPIKESNRILMYINPLSPLIEAPRDLIIYGVIQNPRMYFISSTLSFLIFFMAWRIFHIAETMIAERV